MHKGGDGGDWMNGLVADSLSKVKAGVKYAREYRLALRCKILGKGCFVENTPVLMASSANQFSLKNAGKALVLAAAMPIVPVPIQEVQLLDYAVAHETVNSGYGLTASVDDDVYLGLTGKDPYTSDEQRERDRYEINDTDWNEVVFEEVNGSSTAKLALHDDWIDKKDYLVDEVVNMDLPEQGISGPFRITSIKHILPQKRPVDDDESDDFAFQPITAIFTHQSDDVWTLRFDNGDTLGVTYNHPICSVTAGDWRLAGELAVGEEVLTRESVAVLAAKEYLPGRQRVWNLEVRELHNFLVGEIGVVVHNAYLLDKCIGDLIEHLANKAKYVLGGTGKYKTVRGHHPMSKKVFEGNDNYNKNDAFSVSNDALRNGWKLGNSGAPPSNIHGQITGRQNSLYSAWKAANPNKKMTLDDMSKIEIQAMKAVGIPRDVATGWVVKALQDLKSQGTEKLNNIPWNGINL